MKYFFVALQILIVSFAWTADLFVFDMPEHSTQHIRLLAMMGEAHSRSNYYAMGNICHQGINLRTSGALWNYNLACALALQNNPEEALDTLRTAIELGFDNTEHIKNDPDLSNLRDNVDFNELITELEQRVSAAGYTNTAQRQIAALPPGVDNTVLQAATNTVWSFQTGKFHTFFELPRKEGTANLTASASNTNASPFLIYANRDNNSRVIALTNLPHILKLDYSTDVTSRQLHIGMPNTLFFNTANNQMLPVIGNSSLGFIKSAYWRCQPRAIFNDPEMIVSQPTLLLANQLFCYPAYSDYTISGYDHFPANTPYYIAVCGNSGAELKFTRALAEAISVLPQTTRQYLTAKGILMPTMQMLLRSTQQGIATPADYLSGWAHPTAFLPERLDTPRLIRQAAALTTNNIPPLVMLGVEDMTQLNRHLDMPIAVYGESLFSTHLAVSKIFRAYPYKRRYKVTLLCNAQNVDFHAAILQGDAEKISLKQDADNKNIWHVEVAHHAPFKVQIKQNKLITTSRVDIGFFAATNSVFSMPATLCIYFPGNETRIYDKNERLVSIDYRRYTTPYTDPLICYTREWKDIFHHDKSGRITGWDRIRARKGKERFTAYGDLAVTFDTLGRTVKARRIRYIKRYHGDVAENPGLPPSLAQVDDNIEVSYTYQSDDDFIGKPGVETKMFDAPEL